MADGKTAAEPVLLDPALPESGNEAKEDETMSPAALLEALEKISGGSALKNAIQGRQAAPLIRQYIAALENGHIPTMEELERAKALAFCKLYYMSAEDMQSAAAQGAGDLPLATIALEGALIRHCKRLIAEGHPGKIQLQNHVNSLTSDLFWYDSYKDMPVVWNESARQYCRCHFPDEGMVSFNDFVRLLREFHREGAIARIIFSRIQERIDWKSTEPEVFDAMDPGERMIFLQNWQYLHECARTATPNESEGTHSSATPFFSWYKKHIDGKYFPLLRHALTLPLTMQERKNMGKVCADEICMENGMDKIQMQVSRWGCDPVHALLAFPRLQGRNGTTYGIGPYSDLFLDMYRVMMGDDSALLVQAERDRIRTAPQEAMIRSHVRRNGRSLLLTVIRDLSENNTGTSHEWLSENFRYPKSEEMERILSTLCILAQQSMEREAAYGGLPDLESWGERAKLLLSIQRGRGKKTAEKMCEERRHFLRQILHGGFRDPLASPTEKARMYPGILKKYDHLLPDAFCEEHNIQSPERRKAVPGSAELTERRTKARQEFIAAYRAGNTNDKNAMLCRDWGFTDQELGGSVAAEADGPILVTEK